MSRISGRRFSILAFVIALGLFASVMPIAEPGAAQVGGGATLTVLRGTVGVLRANQTAVQPASSGLTLGTGDRVATLAGSAALLTFFDGSELEMASDATIVISELAGTAARPNITVEAVLGSTVHRVVSLTDPGASYRVESGSTVALVRGTVFGHRAEPHGDVTVALIACGSSRPGPTPTQRTSASDQRQSTSAGGENLLAALQVTTPTATHTPGALADQCVEFPRPGMRMTERTKRTATARGDIFTENIGPNANPLNEVANPAGDSPPGTSDPGQSTGSRVVSQNTSSQKDEKDAGGPSGSPTPTPLPSVCSPLGQRALAPSGTMRAGATQQAAPGGGFIQSFQVSLSNAPSNTTYDIYADQNSAGTIAAHLFVGRITTDGSGNGSFTGSIQVQTAANTMDIELVLQGASPTAHQFIQPSFTPCT